MTIKQRLAGFAAVGAVVAAVTVAGASTASATSAIPSDTASPVVTVDGETVTITADLASVQAACTRAATASERLGKLTARIQGDAETKGSVAWLRARADRVEADGRGELAERLRFRAGQRADRVDTLTAAQAKVDGFVGGICAALDEQ